MCGLGCVSLSHLGTVVTEMSALYELWVFWRQGALFLAACSCGRTLAVDTVFWPKKVGNFAVTKEKSASRDGKKQVALMSRL